MRLNATRYYSLLAIMSNEHQLFFRLQAAKRWTKLSCPATDLHQKLKKTSLFMLYSRPYVVGLWGLSTQHGRSGWPPVGSLENTLHERFFFLPRGLPSFFPDFIVKGMSTRVNIDFNQTASELSPLYCILVSMLSRFIPVFVSMIVSNETKDSVRIPWWDILRI